MNKVANESKALLRARYRALFNREPPKSFGPDLLRRSVAYRIQENAYGALKAPTRRLLDRLVADMLAKPASPLTLPRRAQAGVILTRQWQGKSYQITVLDEGFAYQGKIFTSLSEIARLITGTRWNGPRFFGMRKASAGETQTAEKLQPVKEMVVTSRLARRKVARQPMSAVPKPAPHLSKPAAGARASRGL